MKLFSKLFLFFFVLTVTALSATSALAAVPTIAAVSTTVNGSNVAIGVTGTNFTLNSKILVDGSQINTLFVSSTQLTGTAPISTVSGTTQHVTTVNTPGTSGGTSNSVNLIFISQSFPNPIALNSGQTTFTIIGTGFTAGSMLKIDGGAGIAPISPVSATQIKFSVPSQYFVVLGDHYFVVVNNVATSNQGGYAVRYPPSTISSITPDSSNTLPTPFTLTVNGTGFRDGFKVFIQNAAGSITYAPATAFVSDAKLTASIQPSNAFNLFDSAATLKVYVQDYPSGFVSNLVSFTVNTQPAPSISQISPASVTAGNNGNSLPITITGSNLILNSVIEFRNQANPNTDFNVIPSSVSGSTQLSATIPQVNLVTPRLYTVRINNLSSGGVSANSVTFTVNALPPPPPPTGTIRIVEDSLPNDAQDFVFTNNFGGANPANFSLDDDSNATLPNSRDFTVNVGSNYSVSEATVSGWTQTSATCSDGSPINAISVQNNETVTCTFTNTKNNPAPTISGISPTSIIVGNPTNSKLDITGTNFIASSVVTLFSTPQPIITLTVPANNISSNGITVPANQLTNLLVASYQVTVTNPGPGGGIATAAQQLTVNKFSPTVGVNSSATSASTGGSAYATSFLAGTSGSVGLPQASGTVTYTAHSNSTCTAQSATAGTKTLVNGAIPNSDPVTFTTAGTFYWKAVYSGDSLNNGATGCSTNPLTVTVSNNPVPTITGISPTQVNVGSGAFTLTVTGTNFIPASKIRWNGNDRNTNYGSPTQLTANIPASDLASAGTAMITVFNPAPGGGPSGAYTFYINASVNPYPHISSIAPSSVALGGPAFLLTVNNNDSSFVPSSVVKWNGASRTTHFINSTQITADILVGDLTILGLVNVTVTNPTPGGGTSNPTYFTVNNPPPPPSPPPPGEGKLIIKKDTVGGTGSFDYFIGAPYALIHLDTIGNAAGGTATSVPIRLPAGKNYTVYEIASIGWELIDPISCIITPGSTPTGTSTQNSITGVEIVDGENTTCTFVNDAVLGDDPKGGNEATMVISKYATGGVIGDIFHYNVYANFTSPQNPGPVTGQFDLTVNQTIGENQFIGTHQLKVPAGKPYPFISEEFNPAEWHLLHTSCSNQAEKPICVPGVDANGNPICIDQLIAVAGETINCIFINAKNPSAEDSDDDGIGDEVDNCPDDVNPDQADTNGDGTGDVCEKKTKLIIIKDAVLGNQDFHFTVSAPQPQEAIRVNVPTVNGRGETQTLISLAPGTTFANFAITEDITDGWRFDEITCTIDGSTTGSSILGSGVIANVKIAMDSTTTCIFENKPQGRLIIKKRSLGGTGTFNFNIFGTPINERLETLDIPGQGFVAQSAPIYLDPAAGGYNIQETLPPFGWLADTVTCVGTQFGNANINNTDLIATINVSIVAGQETICTFTNVKKGNIRIIKVSNGGNDTFNYKITGITNFNTSINTMGGIGDNGPGGQPVIPSGRYTITEDQKNGWIFNGATCSTGAPQPIQNGITVQVFPGQTTVCTFVNTKTTVSVQPQKTILQIVKIANGGGGTFNLNVSSPNGVIPFAPITIGQNGGAGMSVGEISINPGTTYTPVLVAETTPPDWTFNSVSCQGFGGSITSLPGNQSISISIFSGNQKPSLVVCTFTNTKNIAPPSTYLKIVKYTSGGDAKFQYSLSGQAMGSPQSTTITTSGGSGNITMPVTLTPSSNLAIINIQEILPEHWEFDGVSCALAGGQTGTQDANSINGVLIYSGHTTTCTFKNTRTDPLKTGKLIIIKNTIGGNGKFTYYIAPTSDQCTNEYDACAEACDEGDGSCMADCSNDYDTCAGEQMNFPEVQTTIVPTQQGEGTSEIIEFDGKSADINEELPEGWDFNSVICKDEDGKEVGTPSENGEPKITEVPIEPGKLTTCTFVNSITCFEGDGITPRSGSESVPGCQKGINVRGTDTKIDSLLFPVN